MSNLTTSEFEEIWTRIDADASANRFSHEAILRLSEFYSSLREPDRVVVDHVLAQWVLADDARRRFDALALIDEFQIRSALPALQLALERLEGAVGPTIPTDRAKLERIVATLR